MRLVMPARDPWHNVLHVPLHSMSQDVTLPPPSRAAAVAQTPSRAFCKRVAV